MSHDTAAALAVAAHPIDMSRWKVTLPIAKPHGDQHEPWEIVRPELRPFSGADDDYNHYIYVRDGAVEYAAPVRPVTGVPTGGSHATRSELRELDAHGNEVTWRVGSSTTTHTLTCTLTCDATGASPHKKCIVGQIHDADGTPPIYLAVEVTGGSAQLNAYLRGTSPHQLKPPLLDGLEPTTVFSYRIQVKGGTCRLWVARGDLDALPGDPQKTFDKGRLGAPGDCFFKAGAYNKSEIDSGSGRVVVRHLRLDLE